MSAVPDFEALEDGIVARLAASSGLAEAFAVGEAAQMRSESGARRFPAAGVLMVGADMEESRRLGAQPVDQMGRLRWAVIVGAMGYRNARENARKGTTGAYAAVRAAIDQLVGYEPVAGFPMQLDGIGPFDFGDARLAGYELTFSHEFEAIEDGY